MLIVFMGIFFSMKLSAAVKTSANNGNWNTGASWTGGSIPATGDSVVIQHIITINAAPVNRPGAVNVLSGATLIINNNQTLTINGSFYGNGNLNLGGNNSKMNLKGHYSFTGSLSHIDRLGMTFSGNNNL